MILCGASHQTFINWFVFCGIVETATRDVEKCMRRVLGRTLICDTLLRPRAGRGEGTVIESLPLVANACVQIMTSLVYEPSSEEYVCFASSPLTHTSCRCEVRQKFSGTGQPLTWLMDISAIF